MQAIANNIRLSFDETGKPEITFTLNLPRQQAQSSVSDLKTILVKGKELSIEVKQHREKRSLDANSYAWVLMAKIADVLRTDKDALYIEMLKRYGQREPQLLSVISDGVDMVYRATRNHCCEVGESELNGKLFKHLAVLIGSSQYDTRQMSIFIDGIVYEAQALDIETMTPDQLLELKSKWGA